MKSDIHPKYFDKAKITCACGKVYVVGATMEEIRTDICSNCHPFYTGQEKIIDVAGRIEKFKTRRTKAEATVKLAPKKERRVAAKTKRNAAK